MASLSESLTSQERAPSLPLGKQLGVKLEAEQTIEARIWILICKFGYFSVFCPGYTRLECGGVENINDRGYSTRKCMGQQIEKCPKFNSGGGGGGRGGSFSRSSISMSSGRSSSSIGRSGGSSSSWFGGGSRTSSSSSSSGSSGSSTSLLVMQPHTYYK